MLSIVSRGLVDNLNLQGIGAYKNQILDHIVKWSEFSQLLQFSVDIKWS